jgi:DNA-binding MarR family transcriptional regulator
MEANAGIQCACVAIRRTARLITQLYEEELPEHLAMPQFGLLSVIENRPGCNQATLARELDFDKTTLSRNLKLMESNGWIAHVASNDRRERGYHVTAGGLKLLKAARPGWKHAQDRLRAALTNDQWEAMWGTFGDLANAAHQARNKTRV